MTTAKLVTGRGLAVIAAFVCPIMLGNGSFGGASESARDAAVGPTIRVVSPQRGGGHILHPSSETKVLIAIEIEDTSGRGIATDDSGRPRFVGNSKNVDLFERNIVARTSYVDGIGRTIIQVVSLVPVNRLQTGEIVITPPIDQAAIGSPAELEAVQFGPGDAIEAALFEFQVTDYEGIPSDPKQGHLTLGLAPGLWTPPASAIKKREAVPTQPKTRSPDKP